MATANNTIDKFGRSRKGRTDGHILRYRGPPGVGFKLVDGNNYDIQNRRLTKIGQPMHESDAVTQKYVTECMDNLIQTFYAAIKEATSMISESIYNRINKEVAIIKNSLLKNKEILDTKIKTTEDNLFQKILTLEKTRAEDRNMLDRGLKNIENTVSKKIKNQIGKDGKISNKIEKDGKTSNKPV